jgi:hypothetical protein
LAGLLTFGESVGSQVTSPLPSFVKGFIVRAHLQEVLCGSDTNGRTERSLSLWVGCLRHPNCATVEHLNAYVGVTVPASNWICCAQAGGPGAVQDSGKSVISEPERLKLESWLCHFPAV